ncbi:hypothetical protein FRC09_016128, partial [Ceratobasidium sp. 395]
MNADLSRLYKSTQLNQITELLESCPPDKLPQKDIDNSTMRNKTKLLRALTQEGPYWVEKLLSLAVDNDNEKLRKRRARREKQVEHTRATRQEQQLEDIEMATDFLGTASEDDDMRSYRDAWELTSNAALEERVCAICARLLNVIEAEMIVTPLNELPHIERLHPTKHHPAQKLTNGCLLEEKGCIINGSDVMVNSCGECRDDLKGPKDVPPKLSLANNLWIGPVPWQLECLTIAENLLIALAFPRVFIIKLFPRDRSRHGLNDNQLQNALRGNVTSFELNSEAIEKMIKGDILPQKPAILASILSVTFVGRGKILNPAALRLFHVRRDAVKAALMWLKENNRYYKNITIDEDTLAALPDNGVPDAISENIRREEDATMIEAESGGYVEDA